MKMSEIFVSESGKLVVGSVGRGIYQDIDHNMIDIVGEFESEHHAAYAAHAINSYDRLAEENAKLREALSSVIESIKNSDDSIIANIDFLPFIKADLLVNQLKEQNNDK